MSLNLHPFELVQVRSQQHATKNELKNELSDQLSADVERFLNGGGVIEVIGTPEKTEFLGNTEKCLSIELKRCNKQAVVDYIKCNPNCTIQQIQAALGLSESTVRKSIRRIDAKGLKLIVDINSRIKRFSLVKKEQ